MKLSPSSCVLDPSKGQNWGTALQKEVACCHCPLFDILNLLTDLGKSNPEAEDKILNRWQWVAKGETLFRAGQPFQSIYAVKSGSFKGVRLGDKGRKHVTGFCLPGDILGLASVGSSKYHCTLYALEDSRVCELCFEKIMLFGGHMRAFEGALIKLMSRQIDYEQRQSVLASRPSAEESLAAFLLNLSGRLEEKGLQGRLLQLSMSRTDIAGYLGLAVETVSRTLKNFHARGFVDVSSKQVHLLNVLELHAIANHPGKG